MWSPFALCLLVGLTYATTNPAWKDNAEYNYQVRGRTFASLHEVSDQHSGILYKANLKIQPRSDGRLQAQISDAKYSQVHSELYEGWKTYIPEAELTWKTMDLSPKPFQIEMKQGLITNLIVSKDISNWQANIIKSIVSQFQMNTNGIGSDQEKYDNQANSAVFVTKEDTVTGNVETVYKINPLPEHLLQGDAWHQSLLEQKGNGDVIEVVKHKNYSENVELPSYFYGFGGLETGEPATNKMGYFFVRNSISRALLTGNLKRYTIQRSVTVNEVQVNPTLSNKQKGSVVSMVNITLQAVKSVGQQIEDVPNPLRLGNLVYSYEEPSSKVHEKQPYKMQNMYADRYQRATNMMRRLRRSLSQDDEFNYQSSEEGYKQQHPLIQEAPESPLLPYTIGFKGMPVKKSVDIVKSVVQLANEIGDDWQDSEKVLHQNTLNKFTTLSALIKIMNSEEIQKAASELYNNSEEGSKRDAWQAFRDSVAESGTGPAFLAIQNWIQSKKIQGVEATMVLAAMSNAVRQPTPQYMKSFFELIQSQEVQSQWPLNDTALLSYSKLVRKVYVVNKKSREQYPIKSFVDFSNEDGEKYMKESVIPYYSQELQEAISQGQTHRIHVFIRSLGNIGHPYILSAYEPYLEGKKQASQYQRVLMVLAMDKLAEIFPHEARSVLFRLYQNPGESQDVRVAAVYQLMRTHPQPELLQYMASYTNIDKDEHVNAAVKSSIEAAAEMEDPQLQSWRLAAQAVKPLLTKKTYGIQYGANYIRNRFVEELKIRYKENIQFIGSEDSFIPKGLKYSLRTNVGGVNKRVVNIQTMVSSLDELINVFQKQTQHYNEQYEQQKQNYDQQKQSSFSSPKIASLLNMQPEELEQLEASLYMELGASYGMLSFDNMTMNSLPEQIRKIEEELKQGKKINFVKMFNDREMALSFPTESGFPFLFIYDTPVALKVQGSVQGSAQPQISQGDRLHTPESLRLNSDLTFTFNSKVQSRISFITPFDHQQYMAGFDKASHVHFPMKSNTEIDVKQMQAKMEFEPMMSQSKSVLHYSTWPYTARVDIKNFQPISHQANTHVVRQKNLHSYEKVWGEKTTGLALKINVEHERQFLDFASMKDMYSKHGPFALIMAIWDDASIQYSRFNVAFIPEQSTTRRIAVHFGHRHEYKASSGSDKEFTFPEDSQQRQQVISDKVSSGIKHVLTEAIDAEIKFQGDKNIKYMATAAYAKSNVDPKSRLLAYFKKNSDSQDSEPFVMSLDVQNEIPNTNALDLDYTMQHEPQAKSKIDFKFGSTFQTASKIKGQLQFSRSEERKEYLKQQPMYQQCKYEMRRGDKQLPPCVNTTMEANLLDRVDMKFQSEKLEPNFEEVLKTVFHAARFNYFPSAEVDSQQKSSPNEINFKVRFDPDLRAVNVSVATPEGQTTFKNLKVDQYAKEVFVVHPVFHLRSRLISKALELDYYRPFSVLDKTQISTFNNRTYPAHISKHWAVMFHYLPKIARHEDNPATVEEQLKYQPEQYVVLVRESSEGSQRRDVRIVVSSPQTEYKVIEIALKSKQSGQYQGVATLNGEVVSFSDEHSFDYKNGYIQIYGLPNREVKVEIRDAFYVIYDGTRLRLTVAEDKFRNAVRGFSGQFNDEAIEDLFTPQSCITRNSYKFVKSYEIEGQEGQQVRQEFANPEQKECVERNLPLYIDVISDEAARRNGYSFQESSGQCTKFQTRYIEQHGEICFTLHAMPVCSSRCQPRGTITKNVPVHCIQKSNAAELWKNQIDKGANPDFSHKKESKTLSMQLPQSCSD